MTFNTCKWLNTSHGFLRTLARDLPHLKMLAAGCRLMLLKTRHTEWVSTHFALLRLLKSVSKLFFSKRNWSACAHCWLRWGIWAHKLWKGSVRPPCGVAQGFKLIPVFRRRWCGAEWWELIGRRELWLKQCTTKHHTNGWLLMSTRRQTIHMSLTVRSWANACALMVCRMCATREKCASVSRVRGVLSSQPVACTTFADVWTRTVKQLRMCKILAKGLMAQRDCIHHSSHHCWSCHSSSCGSCHFLECHQFVEDEEDACDQLTFQ